MIRLALLTSNLAAADSIDHMAQDSGIFKLVHRGSPASPQPAILSALSSADPDVILLEVNDGPNVAGLAATLNLGSRAPLVGFREEWTPEEENSLAEIGICKLLRDPFSISELE